MKVFISWSGERSKRVAQALRTFLEDVNQSIVPWLSQGDIAAGSRWRDDLAKELARTTFGIICLTPEAANSPWLLFEAGALSKSVQNSRVCPYLIGMEPKNLEGPLSQFQSKLANANDTLELLSAINKTMTTGTLTDDRLKRYFEEYWPNLESVVTEMYSNTKLGTARHHKNTDAKLEIIKARELAKLEVVKARELASNALRDKSFPLLIELLRRIKNSFEDLYFSTSPDGGGPIDLEVQSERSELALAALDEIRRFERSFDDELSKVRVFTTRSDYYLQAIAHRFSPKDSNAFVITKEFIENVIDAYNSDFAFLSNEFYKPFEFEEMSAAAKLKLAVIQTKLDQQFFITVEKMSAEERKELRLSEEERQFFIKVDNMSEEERKELRLRWKVAPR